MKISKEIKWTFILNWFLFIAGMIFDETIMACTAVIIFVIISIGVQILEAIHGVKLNKDK